MKEIFYQHRGNKACPSSEEDLEKHNAYPENQITRHLVYGVKHPRSVKQLNTYFASCRQVAENNENTQWDTKEKVDFNTRVALHFVDPEYTTVRVFKVAGAELKVPVYKYRSISFKNLEHIKANGYFDAAFRFHADFLGVTVEQLKIAIIKRCGG